MKENVIAEFSCIKAAKPKKVLFLIAWIIIRQYLTQMYTQSKMGISERFLYQNVRKENVRNAYRLNFFEQEEGVGQTTSRQIESASGASK